MSGLVLEVANVGGITRRETELEPGVSLITGENASNKTSLLQALLFACGRDEVPIRTGADRATVTLTIDGRTVERTAVRSATGVSIEGEPLDDDAGGRDAVRAVRRAARGQPPPPGGPDQL